jgi:hypothetical protein
MRYLAEFLQIVRSRTGNAGPLKVWAQGLLELGWLQQRQLRVPIPIAVPIAVPIAIPIGIPFRNDPVGRGPRPLAIADRQRPGSPAQPHYYRPVSGRNL